MQSLKNLDQKIERIRKVHKRLKALGLKKIIQSVLGENIQISNTIQIAFHSNVKIYAGELVEEDKSIMVEEDGGKNCKYGPTKTRHLKEARRRMIQRGILPDYRPKRILRK